ncbi:glycosyltransferase family 2 protein [Bacillus sp. T3]|uniref:glycosyltransferase family 2 protein n=1 Tax=Bacillus sp. T3 TaxID=467262 RepID=UPI00298245A6|nr:glycosyltransferase family 2 protein [Bacillus sp. T3]
MDISTKYLPSVYIVILNYNNPDDTIACVEEAEKINYENFKIIIVDNFSKDNSEAILKQRFPQHTFLQTGANLGYAGGNNIGMKFAKDQNADYICILNNDVITDKDFLKMLLDYLETNPNVGVVGPRVCEYDKPELVQSTGAMINFNTGRVNVLNNLVHEDQVKGKIISCDYVGGACLLFKSNILNEVGYFPEDYFLFYEETEWCLNIKKMGYEVICYCDAKVIHKGSASINQISGLSEYFMYRNVVIFMNRNAKMNQLLVFYPYLILYSLYRGVIKKDGLKFAKYFYHGLTSKNKYENKL